jgi:hypothetical protein
MTSMRCKGLVIWFLLFLAPGIRSQVPEYTHQVVRSFKASPGVTLDVANKYGKVQVIKWNYDSVKITVDVRVRAKDPKKLQKLVQEIDFDFIPGQYYLVAHTRIGEGGSEVIQDLVDIAGTYISGPNAVTINYTIYVPQYTPLKIENKFGDVYLDDMDQGLNLNLSYGDFTCNRLNAKSEIRITSGNAEIGVAKDATLFISYAKLHVHEAGRITAETKSSTVTIDKSSWLKINSRRDKLFLNEIGSMTGESYFSQINGGTLLEDMNFLSRYGSIRLDDISRSFSRINLTAEYTQLSLYFDRSASYNLDLTHHQDVVFSYPKATASLRTKVVNAQAKIFQTTGTIGGAQPSAEVVLNVPKKCNVTLISK